MYEVNSNGNFIVPKYGLVRVGDIILFLNQLGIKPPISFLFEEMVSDISWKGYVIPPLNCKAGYKRKKKLSNRNAFP